MLKFMYITNKPEVAKIVEAAGIDRVFIDMEYIGKSDRQGGMDTVQSRHTVEDIAEIKKVVSKTEIIVRCNPIHKATKEYISSREEINAIISAGVDLIMLPYFKTVREVKKFLKIVKGRVKTLLLIETPEAVACIDKILALDGIDEVLIGLNDLSLGYKKKFMFELLTDGTVENLCQKFKRKGIPYGFGGIASLGKGLLPSEMVIGEHYRLGSTCAILSRSFCNVNEIADIKDVEKVFDDGVKAIRDFEQKCKLGEIDFEENKNQVRLCVEKVVSNTR